MTNLRKKFPDKKKGSFLTPQFFHLFKFWIQDPFLAQMKKIEFGRAH